MPSFPKPKFTFNFTNSDEIDNIKAHKATRDIPDKSNDKLLIASWNVANLGLQIRSQDHYEIIAEMISWFDLIAIQEGNDNLIGLKAIESQLPSHSKEGTTRDQLSYMMVELLIN